MQPASAHHNSNKTTAIPAVFLEIRSRICAHLATPLGIPEAQKSGLQGTGEGGAHDLIQSDWRSLK